MILEHQPDMKALDKFLPPSASEGQLKIASSKISPPKKLVLKNLPLTIQVENKKPTQKIMKTSFSAKNFKTA